MQNPATGFQRETTTGSEGFFDFPGLPTGMYEVSVEKDGFTPAKSSGVVLAVGQTRTLNYRMQVGTLAT